jgi:hypothetical protein
MKTLSFDDSNAFRWTAKRPDGGKYTITVEKDATYKRRVLEAPGDLTEQQLRAFVEVSVAIPERVAPSTPKKRPAAKPPNTPPSPSPEKPAPPPKTGGGGAVLLLLLVGVLLLGKKGR